MKFTKMHGNGNDFIIVDEFKEILVDESEKPKFVRAVCHRHFGVGADGVIFVQKSEKADAKFRYFNSDGSEAEMCGNGIRCFSRYVVEEGYAGNDLRVETLAGVLELKVYRDEKWWIRVNMGKPVVGEVWGKKLEVNGREFTLYEVRVGVPHVVIFVNDLDFDIIPFARKIRYMYDLFPEGTNVNFAKVEDGRIRIRTYERGVEDETLSCGTGSVATAKAANALGFVGKEVEVVTKGGLLKIELNDVAYMTGSAARVFEGELNLDELYEV